MSTKTAKDRTDEPPTEGESNALKGGRERYYWVIRTEEKKQGRVTRYWLTPDNRFAPRSELAYPYDTYPKALRALAHNVVSPNCGEEWLLLVENAQIIRRVVRK